MEDLKMKTRAEVVELLRTTTYTVDMLRDTAVLRPIKIGKHYLYSPSEIKRFQTEFVGYSFSWYKKSRES